MKNEKLYYGIRLFAGAYIFYLGVRTLWGMANGTVKDHSPVLLILSILISVAGVAFIVWGIRGMIRSVRSGQADAEETAASETEPEEIPDSVREEMPDAEAGQEASLPDAEEGEQQDTLPDAEEDDSGEKKEERE